MNLCYGHGRSGHVEIKYVLGVLEPAVLAEVILRTRHHIDGTAILS